MPPASCNCSGTTVLTRPASRRARPCAAGTLSSVGQVDLFRTDLTAGQTYEFHLEGTSPGLAVQDREIALYNEFGQLIAESVSGSLTTDVAQAATGSYLLEVQALDPLGLGSYSVSGSSTGSFPTEAATRRCTTSTSRVRGPTGGTPRGRSTGPTSSRSSWRSSGRPTASSTSTRPSPSLPTAASTHLVAYGTFPTMNAGGLGGGSVGNRRVSGTAACMVTDESTWTGLADEIWAFDVAHHEAGHATGGMPHQQNPRGIDAGDDGGTHRAASVPG